MSRVSAITLILIAMAAVLVAALFTLYQNPLMEIYLADWALC
jgi:hypothetical protein